VSRQRLTILSPVFDEESVVPLFFVRMQPVVARLAERYDVRIVFVNNASTDDTVEAILSLRADHPWVHVVSLSTNVGYQRSLDCGLTVVDSDLYAIIDVDCEDPPEMIEAFVEAHERGFDIVYGERIDRPEPTLLKLARRRFYRITRAIADDEIILDMAEFSLVTREVRDALIADETSFPFIRASIGRVGFRRCAIPYTREPRIGGKTHYNVFGLVTFAVAGILSASTWLLRMTIYLLPLWIAALVGLAVAVATVDARWPLPTLLVLAASYIGAAISFVAIYVARVYKNTLGRPNFFIDSKLTFADHDVLMGSYADRSARMPTMRLSG
jgi:glycosyltransferase involved in cell wall biosynthesis